MSKMSAKFIRNDAPAVASRIQSMVVNLLPKSCRIDTMEGREFIVVPMVILTEGVHNGSDGPLYYPKEELGKTPVVWNQKPIVVYHPEMNGQGISACDPTVITNRKVGVMMNTTFENGKLKSEAWIEKARADLIDLRIMEAVDKNEMMEVSTGVFVDMEAAPGDWNGETYQGIARNFRPDHLALLPDKIGACSIADGAGFLRNHEGKKASLAGKVLQMLGLAKNEMSFANTRDSLQNALRKRFNVNTEAGPWLWVEDVYTNFVIYEWGNKLWRLGFTSSDTGVTLSTDEPTEVVRVTEYRTAVGTFVGNKTIEPNHINMKKTLIDKIIGNAAAGFTEADRPKLEALSEPQLTAIAGGLGTSAPAPATNTAPVPAPVAAPVVVAAPVANATPVAPTPAKPQTIEEYIAAAPKGVAEVLTNGVAAYNAEKTALVEQLCANANCPFTKEDLSNRPLGELRSLAKLAGVAAPAANVLAPNFGGQAPTPTGNTTSEEVMEMPTMNFGKAAAK